MKPSLWVPFSNLSIYVSNRKLLKVFCKDFVKHGAEYSVRATTQLISFRMDWLDLLVVQGTLKSLLQHHSSKASILWCSAFFIVQPSHPYMTTGKAIALTTWTFVGKVMSLLFNMVSRLVITFLPKSKCLLISWLRSPSTMITPFAMQSPYLEILNGDKHEGTSLTPWRLIL